MTYLVINSTFIDSNWWPLFTSLILLCFMNYFSYRSSCECMANIATPPVDREHCQYSGWVAITDKHKLPVRRLFLMGGGMKAVIGNIQCIEGE